MDVHVRWIGAKKEQADNIVLDVIILFSGFPGGLIHEQRLPDLQIIKII